MVAVIPESIDKLMAMKGDEIARIHNVNVVTILPLYVGAMPRVVYWKNGPEASAIGDFLGRQGGMQEANIEGVPHLFPTKRIDSWMLIGGPSINPAVDPILLAVVINNKYVAPGDWEYRGNCGARITPQTVEFYNKEVADISDWLP